MFRRSLTSGLFAAFFIFPSIQAQAQTCYWPDGTDRITKLPNSTFEICTPTVPGSQHAMCCDTTAHNGGPSKCTPNGLCYYNNFATFFREGCTDPTWQDPACLKLYPNGTAADPSSHDRIWVNACTSNLDVGPWCDHDDKDSCCAANKGFLIEGSGVVPYASSSSTSAASTPIISSTVATGIAASTEATATGTTSNTTQSQTGSTNTAAIAAGIVGGLLAGVLVSALVFFLLRRRKQQAGTKASDNVEDDDSRRNPNSEKAVYVRNYNQRVTVSEMPGSLQPEVYGSVPRYELEQPSHELPHADYIYVKK